VTNVPRIVAGFVSLIICIVQPAAAQTTFLDFNIGTAEGLSGNGRFVVHLGDAYGLTSGVSIYDRQTGQHERVDVSSAGVPSNNLSFCPSVSGTGRFVAFASVGNNLVAGDSNFVPDVFVRDRQTGQTTRESFYANGAQLFLSGTLGCPSISDDGRYVVFNTQEPLVKADTNNGNDTYVRDRTLATTTIVSVTSAGQVVSPHGAQSDPRISANGRFVTWNSYGPLVSGSMGFQVWVRDLQTSQTTLVSRSTERVPGDYISGIPAISGDGRYVAFYSRASNLVAGDVGFSDAFVHDRETGVTRMVSVSSAGAQANYHSGLDNLAVPSISYDGRYISFMTRASNLVPSDTNDAEDIFVRDQVTQTTFRATLKSDGSESTSCLLNGATGGPSFLSYSGSEILLMTALRLVHFNTGPECSDSLHPYIRRLPPPAPAPGGFTNDPLTSGAMIKAVHITELRVRIDALRAAHTLRAYGWTDPVLTPASSVVRAQHIVDLRTALAEAYAAAGVTPPAFVGPGPDVGTTIRAEHIADLRRAVVALE
jgi:Tol biopolymer transport system component